MKEQTADEIVLNAIEQLNEKVDKIQNHIEKSMDKPSDKSVDDEGDDTDKQKLEESEKAMKIIA